MSLDSWVSSDGSTFALDGSEGIKILRGPEGLDARPVSLTIEQRVAAAGGVLVNRREPPRTVTLPLLVDLTVTTVSAVAASFQGPGVLVSSEGRQLRDLVYVDGFEGRWSVDTGGVGDLSHRKFDVELLALDPWWYGDAVQQSFVFGAATAWDAAIPWDSPIPWNGGSAMTATITGDTDALPLWTITGAVTELIVSNGSQSWTWTEDLASGDYGTVDHRPGSRSPRLGSELNGVAESGLGLWFLLANSSTLDWGLSPGENSLVVSVAGDDASSALDLWYEPKWLTPG